MFIDVANLGLVPAAILLIVTVVVLPPTRRTLGFIIWPVIVMGFWLFQSTLGFYLIWACQWAVILPAAVAEPYSNGWLMGIPFAFFYYCFVSTMLYEFATNAEESANNRSYELVVARARAQNR